VEYVQGEVSMPFQAPDLKSAMQRVGRLLRDLHDASAEYVPPDDAVWNIVIPADRCDLIIHHDAAPWNLVLNAYRWVLIDWDARAPGSRLWDLAYAAHGFIPLAPDTSPSAAGRLLAAMADGYGLSGEQRAELSALLAPRILEHVSVVGAWPHQQRRAVGAVVVGGPRRGLAGRCRVRRAAPPAVPRSHPQQRVGAGHRHTGGVLVGSTRH